MGYEPDLDVTLETIGVAEIDENRSIGVEIKSYDGGKPKMAIVTLYRKRNGEMRTSAAKRLDAQETRLIRPLIAQAEEWFQAQADEFFAAENAKSAVS
jgi:hypothetical protein